MADQPTSRANPVAANAAEPSAAAREASPGGAESAAPDKAVTATLSLAQGNTYTGGSIPPRTENTKPASAVPTRRPTSPADVASQKSATDKPASGAASEPAKNDTAKQAAAPSSVLEEHRSRLDWMTVAPSWLVSLIVHMLLLFALALVVEPVKLTKQIVDLVATDASPTAPLDDSLTDLPQGAIDAEQSTGLADALSLSPQADGTDITMINELPAAPSGVGEVASIGLAASPVLDYGAALGGGGGTGGIGGISGLDGRGDAARKALVHARGGTPGSENAVGLGLAWLAHHQNQDGSWSFDHRKGPCQGRCTSAGKMEHGEIAATAIALLPFLGAGQTHLVGDYKKTVQNGLYYLISRMHVLPDKGGDLSYDQGNMYAHGLASIALCEAYGMTKDAGLAEPAQLAINFIVYAQDEIGGGWRYVPHQPGDTSVVGWQLMALKSAHMAYLNVPPKTIKGVVNFLNSVQQESGATYGYTGPGRGQATTAIGLLCRMYLGWKHDEPALERGVAMLSAHGPSDHNMYFNYYATQVLHHYEGEEWTKWNNKMREFLVNSQSRGGHERGSWFFGGDDSAAQGGRVYTTAMAVMTLEVYYRHLPIYRKDSTTSDFDE